MMPAVCKNMPILKAIDTLRKANRIESEPDCMGLSLYVSLEI